MNAACPDALFIGLMSGTSLDGVDGVLCRLGADGRWLGVLTHAHRPFPERLRGALMALQASGPDELHRAALAGNALALVYAEVVQVLLDTSQTPATAVRAIGAHGQTVRHQPGLHDGIGYTLQLGNGALLAERTGIDVIADLRSRDVAAGGQGAPLVPCFHQHVFGRPDATRAVVNIGGISNLTILRPGEPARGFDCGPGNALMDHWIHRHHGAAYDDRGSWAASGTVWPTLLADLLVQPYFAQQPPKSTGRDLFHPAWLQERLDALAQAGRPMPSPVDVQATLCEFTAAAIADDVRRHAPDAADLLVCGGGAFNDSLIARLKARLVGLAVHSTDTQGLPALQVEAAAFAWLACMHVHRRAANEPAVTGAAGLRVLGACYPA
ncbi:anhydro-N-acetylmuramic acid kinase [Sphaerotilus sp.]|uniref:anhydro-N-acetylmuramic acid kinase n=1 Tax=Sphaerotilus sp. TaxID=2093942 RepID=UPI0034E2DB90